MRWALPYKWRNISTIRPLLSKVFLPFYLWKRLTHCLNTSVIKKNWNIWVHRFGLIKNGGRKKKNLMPVLLLWRKRFLLCINFLPACTAPWRALFTSLLKFVLLRVFSTAFPSLARALVMMHGYKVQDKLTTWYHACPASNTAWSWAYPSILLSGAMGISRLVSCRAQSNLSICCCLRFQRVFRTPKMRYLQALIGVLDGGVWDNTGQDGAVSFAVILWVDNETVCHSR